jgi:hypothetical protein
MKRFFLLGGACLGLFAIFVGSSSHGSVRIARNGSYLSTLDTTKPRPDTHYLDMAFDTTKPRPDTHYLAVAFDTTKPRPDTHFVAMSFDTTKPKPRPDTPNLVAAR